MKTFKITIEETISQAFDIDANTIEEAMAFARKDYLDGFLVVENPTLIDVQMMAEDEETNTTKWVEI